MQQINAVRSPDTVLLLNEDTLVDQSHAASLAFQHRCMGNEEQATAWERLAQFLRVSEAYIFDDMAGSPNA